jgi:hypothetical protein
MNETSSRLGGYCSICWRRDGVQGAILQQCHDCKVLFHNDCYGMPSEMARDPHLLCHACKSVGDVIKVRQRDSTGKRIAIEIKERPTECCLCSVDDKEILLPMHPVYDDYGSSGRQILLPADPTTNRKKRLAWAHSLCAFVICSTPQTAGCVYGTTREGTFDGVESEDDTSVESVNSYLDEDRDDITIHHFVYVLDIQSKQKNKDWTERIRQNQISMKCIYCGRDDRPEYSYRIPIQCCANDDTEFSEFRGKHPSIALDDTCFQAMHVGCAMYGRNEAGELPDFRRVFFYPGKADGDESDSSTNNHYVDCVSNAFCDIHAKELGKKSRFPAGSKVARQITRTSGQRDPLVSPRKLAPKTTGIKKGLALMYERSSPAHSNTVPVSGNKRVRLATLVTSSQVTEDRIRSGTDKGKTQVPLTNVGKKSFMKPLPVSKSATRKLSDYVNDKQKSSRNQICDKPDAPKDMDAALQVHLKVLIKDISAELDEVGTRDVSIVKTTMQRLRAKWKRECQILGITSVDFVELWRYAKASIGKKFGIAFTSLKRNRVAQPIVPQADEKLHSIEKCTDGDTTCKIPSRGKQNGASMDRTTNVSCSSDIDNGPLNKPSVSVQKVTKKKLDKMSLEEIATSLQNAASNVESHCLHAFLETQKDLWKEKKIVAEGKFESVWSSVSKIVHRNHKSRSKGNQIDWSYLVVGKKYDPDRMDFSKWDTYEELR